MIKQWLDRILGRVSVAGAAKVTSKPGVFTEVYAVKEFNGAVVPQWFFAWYKEDHSDGAILGPYVSKADAELMRSAFVSGTKKRYAVVGVGR